MVASLPFITSSFSLLSLPLVLRISEFFLDTAACFARSDISVAKMDFDDFNPIRGQIFVRWGDDVKLVRIEILAVVTAVVRPVIVIAAVVTVLTVFTVGVRIIAFATAAAKPGKLQGRLPRGRLQNISQLVALGTGAFYGYRCRQRLAEVVFVIEPFASFTNVGADMLTAIKKYCMDPAHLDRCVELLLGDRVCQKIEFLIRKSEL